ncbi:MAG: sulfatase-like hydrolase/transferase [Saprospiraceae bacterium]|nr:sulfatase-like hydrolase/transferase [Saprospiraceae bacterium]
MIVLTRFYVLFFFLSIYTSSFSQDARPNMLWIIAEDMSQDQACYGNTLVKTPNIDALANEGMRFAHTFTAAGVCSPSRSLLATGMYQNGFGAMHMCYADELRPALPRGVKTIAQIMRDHGYQTVGGEKDDYMFKLQGDAVEYEDITEIDVNRLFFAKGNYFYPIEFSRKTVQISFLPSRLNCHHIIRLCVHCEKIWRHTWRIYNC